VRALGNWGKSGVTVLAAVLAAMAVLSSCRRASPERTIVSVTRPAGAWQGTGTKTVGDISSESGHFRITWRAGRERPAGQGTFRLTVRSAVSGRTLQVVVDHHGEGSGVVNFEDAPRIYDFLVESQDVEWAFSVEEIYEAYAKAPEPPAR